MPLHVERLEAGPLLVVDVGGRVPVAAVWAWFRVGAARERPRELGAAHFIEHLSFRARPGLGEPAARIEAMGGSANAFTSYDETAWQATVPAERAAEALALLLEMAVDPVLDAEAVERERRVIAEELRGAADDPAWVLGEAVRRRFWGAHPFGRPVLGTPETLASLGPAELRAFHRRGYRPESLVVSVAGPVAVAPLREAVAAAVARWPRRRGSAAAPKGRARRLRPGPVVVDGGFEDRLVEVDLPLPPPGHEDEPALDVLAACLGDGSSSLLSARLHHDLDLVAEVGASLVPERPGSALVVEAAAREGRVAEAVEGVARVLAEVARRGPDMAALRRARASILADRLGGRETVEGRAWRRAWNAGRLDDPRADAAYEAALERVTLADLRRVAARWLDLDRAVVGVLCPERELDARRAGRAFRRGARGGAAVAPRRAPDAPVVRGLDNGLRVVVLPDEASELVAVSVVGAGGLLAEDPDEAGLASAWAELVVRGAGPHDALEFAAAVEERAGSAGGFAGRSTAGVQLLVPAADQRIGFELLGWCLRAPRFDAREVDRARRDLAEAAALRADDPASLAAELAWAALFAGHPWGRPLDGTPEGIARLAPEALRAYHDRVARGRNLVVAVVGAVDPDEAARRVARELGRLPAGAPFPARPPSPLSAGERRRRAPAPRPGSPAVVLRVFRGVGLEHEDAPAAQVLEAALAGVGGGTGRLWTALREDRGLAYDVAAYADLGVGGGALACSAIVDPERAGEARRVLDATLEALRAAPPDAEEVARLGRSLVAAAAPGLQRASALAGRLALEERFGRGAARWREPIEAPGRVTAEAVARVARELLRPEASVLVEVGGEGDPRA